MSDYIKAQFLKNLVLKQTGRRGDNSEGAATFSFSSRFKKFSETVGITKINLLITEQQGIVVQ